MKGVDNQMSKTKETAMPKARVSDFVKSALDDFYPGAPRTNLADVILRGDVVILDCAIVDDFETEYGLHPLAVIAIADDLDSDPQTFPCSGMVIIRKLRKLKEAKAFPIVGEFVKRPDKRYYDLI